MATKEDVELGRTRGQYEGVLTAIWFIVDEVCSDPAASSMGVDLSLRALRRMLAYSVPAAKVDEDPS